MFAVTLTLMARPLGAFVFGLLAEKYGRRPMLMLDVALFSVFELASAFVPNLTMLFVVRLLFGFAMGGEWGLGSSLTMELIPEKSRGFVSGLLQEGYACGNLLAALLFWILFDHIGWRGMFVVGFVPALLVLYIRATVPESPVWEQTQTRPAHERHPLAAMKGYWGRALFMIVLMTLFNCFSHGTQDLYPLFLQVEKGFGTDLTGKLVGHRTDRRHRRRTVLRCAVRTYRAQEAPSSSRRRCRCRSCGRGRSAHADDARTRRVLAAGDGAGCVGRGAGASQRAVAGCGARDVAGIVVSDRQFHLGIRAVAADDRWRKPTTSSTD